LRSAFFLFNLIEANYWRRDFASGFLTRSETKDTTKASNPPAFGVTNNFPRVKPVTVNVLMVGFGRKFWIRKR